MPGRSRIGVPFFRLALTSISTNDLSCRYFAATEFFVGGAPISFYG